MGRYNKILVLLLFVLVLFRPSDLHAQSITSLLQINPELITNPKSAPVFIEDCSKYPGFMNRIYQCINHISTRGMVFSKLAVMNRQFSMLTNVALVLYLMFFGMRLSLNVVENVKGEIMVVIITCFFITYVNNAIRMETFVKFFIGLQQEFVNVATVSIYSAQKTDPNFQKYVCYTKTDAKGNTYTYTNIWSRVDCLIAYIMGAHPIIARMGQIYDQKGSTGGKIGEMLGNAAGDVAKITFDQRYIYPFSKPKDASTDPSDGGTADGEVIQSFEDMAYKPYDFNKYWRIEDILKIASGDSPSLPDVLSQAQNADASYANQMNKARPIYNNFINVGLSFSLVVIMIGMLFNDPTIGIMVFMTGFFIILLIVAAFGQALLVYITSLFAILVLGLFAPIILPTVLFQQTRRIFETWVQLLFAYAIQPGILLCYLSFMVYVLQYVINHKNCLNSLDTGSTEKKLTCGLADYHFGEMYTKADKSNVKAVEVVTKNNAALKSSHKIDMMRSAFSDNEGERNPEQLYSLIGKSDSALDPIASKIALEDNNELLRRGFKLKGQGTNSSEISLPGFSFFGGNILGKPDLGGGIAKLFYNYDTYQGDLEKAIKSAQDNQKSFNLAALSDPDCLKITAGVIDVKETVTCITKKDFQQQYILKTAYMQTLFIILITLAITFVFMGNVMSFTGKLVGVGTSPIGKAMNLYDMTTNKLSKMLKGPVR